MVTFSPLTSDIMFDTNLSKIKPKFRTSGNVTGNFGKSKVKAGSNMNSIGLTQKISISITKQSDYLNRMKDLYVTTSDEKMKRFALNEIKKYERRKITH